MGFECASQSKIGAMFLCYVFSAGLSGLVLFSLPDRWGRVKSMRFFGGINLLAQLLVIFVPNYYSRLIGFTLMGMTQLKGSISYVWMFESVETKDKSTVCGIMNCFDAATLGVMCIYFM
jgi:MFS family permease